MNISETSTTIVEEPRVTEVSEVPRVTVSEGLSAVAISDASEMDDIEFIRRHMNGKDVTEWLEEFMQPREYQDTGPTGAPGDTVTQTSRDTVTQTSEKTENASEETENLEFDLTKVKNRAARRLEKKHAKKAAKQSTQTKTTKSRGTKLRAKKPRSNVIFE